MTITPMVHNPSSPWRTTSTAIALFGRHELIFAQGDAARTAYYVLEGAISLQRGTPEGKSLAVGFAGPGNVFGQEAAFGQCEREFSAVAMTTTKVLSVVAQTLAPLLRGDGSVAFELGLQLSRQFNASVRALEALAFATVEERLRDVLELLANDFGERTHDGTRVPLVLSQADLANFVGSTRETVSVAMKSLRQRHAVRLDGGCYVLLDRS